jgi:PAS domain S-box-containing protein
MLMSPVLGAAGTDSAVAIPKPPEDGLWSGNQFAFRYSLSTNRQRINEYHSDCDSFVYSFPHSLTVGPREVNMIKNAHSDKFADTSTGSVQSLRQRAEEVLQRQPEELREMPPEDIQHLIHELEVHQVELEIQNEELRRIQRELELSRDRYSDLYDFAPVGYFTVSVKGLILEANLTAATMLGVERGRLIKQPLSRFILREDQNNYYLHRNKLFETQQPQVWEMRMVRGDDSQFWARIEGVVARDSEGQPVCRATMGDITERKRAEEELKQTVAELERTNAELTQFNRLAVGRELRMIELKRQINKLSEQLGEKPPYDLSFLE